MKEKDLPLFSKGVQWLQHDQRFDHQDKNWLDFKNHWNDCGQQPLKALFGNVTGCCSNGQKYENDWCLFDDKKLGSRDRINLHGRFETEDNIKTFTKTQRNTTISRGICNLLVYVACSPKDFSPKNKNFKSKDRLSEYKLKFFSK